MKDKLYHLAEELGAQLGARKWLLAAAESCTGGGLAQAITRVPGCSHWFDCGFVTYSNASKIRLLEVSSQLIHEHGPVSQQVVQAMAEGVLKNSQAKMSIAISGIAGPDSDPSGLSVGTIWLACCLPGTSTQTRQLHLSGTRREIQDNAVEAALSWVLSLLKR